MNTLGAIRAWTASATVGAVSTSAKNLAKRSGRQFCRASWYAAYGSRYASFAASGTDADHGAAASASRANAMWSSSIELMLTAIDGGRKCLSNSGMCSSSHAFATQYVRLGAARQSTVTDDGAAKQPTAEHSQEAIWSLTQDGYA